MQNKILCASAPLREIRNCIIAILLLVHFISTAQNATRKYISHTENGNRIDLKVSDGNYAIRFYNNNIVETSFIPNGQTFNPESHAVILNPENVNIQDSETTNTLEFGTPGIEVRIQKSPFKITYSYSGKELVSEKNGYTKKDSTEVLEFNLDKTETLYGGGARVLGMNRRGNRLQLYNRAQYGYENRAELTSFTMPIVLSSKIYALHFDNAPIGYLDLDSKKDNTLAYETISGRKTYQVIAGDNWLDLIENYTALTGRQPLPPRWVFGNFASRFGYHSEKEVRATVDKFRTEKIPLDAIILDLYWFGKEVKGTMGNLAFDLDSFPNPKKMMSDLKLKGVKTILITEPFVLTTSKRWQEAVDQQVLATDKTGKPFTYDFFFGNTGLIDIFSSKGKDWFWNIYKNLQNEGVSGSWGDLGEPELHPAGARHAAGSANEIHNIYGHNWAKLVFEGYQRDFPNQRPFILMRSGYSGSQRFGMIPWSGDVNRTWGGFSGQTELALQMGMQGMAYMHSDLGGFAGPNLDDELYTRWLQYGIFQPIFRPHAQEEVASEPVFREAKTKALTKKAIELRYQLLPYNYTIAFQNESKGTPLMRPLFFEEPENESLLAKSDEYLWGNDFLVDPVIEKGQTEKNIYFPKSANWFDFYTGEKFEGGKSATIKTHPEYIPTFVRGGAIIPMTKIIQSTEAYNANVLELHYFYDENATDGIKGSLYDDDGKTPNDFEKEAYELVDFVTEKKDSQINLNIFSGAGPNFKSNDKKFTVIVHNVTSKPLKVISNKLPVKFTYNPTTKQVIFDVVHTKTNGDIKKYNGIDYQKRTSISITLSKS